MKQLKFIFLLSLVILNVSASGQQRGKYKDGRSNRDVPLTTFDRHNNMDSFIRETIRYKVIHQIDGYKRIYEFIYNNGNTGPRVSVGHCYDVGVCNISTTAKDAAFVYLMGFDKDGVDLDGIGIDDPGRAHFYEVARDILLTQDDNYGSFRGLDNHQWRAKELIQLLQAHDYLTMAANAHISTYPESDRIRDVLAHFTYELYSHANNIGSTLDRYSNLTLITAGAIGMAACILSDHGTYGILVQRRPERWANAAHAYINRTLWTGPSILSGIFTNAPRSHNLGMCDTCVAGYSEGPGYFQYGFEALFPFFVTFQNFVDQDQDAVYYTKALNFSGERVRNYVYEPLFEQNLYKWIKNISMPNGDYPSIDDTRTGYNMGGTLALARGTKDNYSIADTNRLQLGGVAGLQLRQDYLGAFNPYVKPKYKKVTKFPSGNLILRKVTDSLPTEHYLHVNIENQLNNGGAHEHGDISSFIIAGGEDILAIDPGYHTFPDRDDVADGFAHNLISIDGKGPNADDLTKSSKTTSDGRAEVEYSYWNYHIGSATSEKALMTRNVQPFDEGNLRYYEIDYEVKNNNWYQNEWVQFNLNGNGNTDYSTCYMYPGRDNVVIWDHPCHKDNNKNDNYKMQVSLTTYLDSSVALTAVTLQNGYKHGNSGGDENQRYNLTPPSNSYKSLEGFNAEICKPSLSLQGIHTRMRKQVQIGPDHKVQFKATIQILGCNENQDPPKMVMNTRYTSHLLAITTPNELLYNFHLSRTDHSTTPDTVMNPLGINTSAILKTDAKRAFFSYSPNRLVTSGRCISYSNFRKASMIDADSLIYHDTVYISSDNRAEVNYKLVGKFKYTGYAQITLNPTIVKFFLPDLISGYEMTANATRGKIDSVHYDTATRTIAIWMPAGYTEFSIELADPCLVSCYFPSTAETINSTFLFDDGTEQTLVWHSSFHHRFLPELNCLGCVNICCRIFPFLSL